MILTRKKLAEALFVSERTINRLEKQGLPVLLLGKNTPRYEWGKVLRFLVKHSKQVYDPNNTSLK